MKITSDGIRGEKSPSMPSSNLSIVTREFKTDPFPFYARLRAERPVSYVTLPDAQTAWLVVRYNDVLSVLKDPRFAKNPANAMTADQIAKQPWIPNFAKPLTRNMLDLDEPEHGRLRNLVQKAFTPGRVDSLVERIQEICEQLLDRMAVAHSADLVAEYALQVPLTIIVELLGIPVRDRERFHRWSKAIVKTPTKINMVVALPSLFAFLRYLRQLFRELRMSAA